MTKPQARMPPDCIPAPAGPIANATAEWLAAFKPRVRPKLSTFMWEHARTDEGTRIRPFPFQEGIADAFTDPETEQLSVRKSSRIGYSTILQCFIAWRIKHDPARTLIYQPTIDDAEKYSRDDLDPVLQWDVVRSVAVFKPRDRDNQIRAKRYKGGWIQIKGANSPKEFRRVTSDDVFLEECDGYPWASKDEGDPARLAFKRNLTSPRRFSAAGSTPKIKGLSRIDALYEQGSQEQRYVPCPHCGTMQPLIFGDGSGAGLRWAPKEKPTRVWYRCVEGCDIDESHKAEMDEAGEWRAHNPEAFPRHRSFHIWAAYSQHPGAAWPEIVREFLEVRKDPNLLKTWVNQVLGEAWQETGEAPEWQRLYDRREAQPKLGTAPAWTGLLVGSADVQRGSGGQGRIELDIWAFGEGRRRAFVEQIVVEGRVADKKTWAALDAKIAGAWPTEDGRQLKLARVGIDSGDGENTMHVYAWARRHPGIVMSLKGRESLAASQAIEGPSWVDLTISGKKIKRGAKLWKVGTSLLKLELYGQLSLDRPEDGEEYPDGYVYLPEGTTAEWIKQLVSEQLVLVKQRNGRTRRQWQQTRARNEALDNAVYARAVAISLGVDQWSPAQWRKARGETRKARVISEERELGEAPAPASASAPETRKRKRTSRLTKGGGWLERRR